MTENSKEKVGGTQMLRSVYFELGRELVTPGIYGAMKASNKFTSEIMLCNCFVLETGARYRWKTKR